MSPDPTVEAYDPKSLDGRADLVRRAFRAQHPPKKGKEPEAAWPVEVYDDAIVVEEGPETYRRYPWSLKNGDITFGKGEEVTPAVGWKSGTGTGTPDPPHAAKAEEADTEATIPQGQPFTETIGGTLLESLDNGEGRIWRVTLIRPGTSLNGRRYRPEVLAEAMPLYEGAKCFDGHRTGPERQASAIGRLVGWHENVGLGPDGGIQADLHLTEAAEQVRATLLTAWRNNRPDLVGFSHDVVGIPQPATEGGRSISDTARITAVNSVDVVADPAAGGRLERLVASRHEQGEETMTEPTLPANGDPTTPAAAVEAKPITEAVELSPVERRLIMREALEAVNLPEPVKAKIREQAGSLTTEAAIQARVKEAADLYSELLAARPAGLPGQARVEVGAETADRLQKGLDGMLEGRSIDGVPAFRSLREAYFHFTGRHPYSEVSADLAQDILAESIGCVAQPGRRLTESITSATWSSALGDSITRKAVKDFNGNVAAWGDFRKFCSSVPVSDFRTQRREGLGYYDILSTVAQGDPYPPLTSPTDQEATYAVTKKGGTDDLTREAIINDDLGLIRRIPQRLGRAAALTLSRAVWVTTIQGNATIYDSVALFDAAHSNLGSTALGTDGAGLVVARNAMLTQTLPGETHGAAGILPKFLLVPPELFATVHGVFKPAPGRTTDTPWYAGGIEPIECAFFTDANDYGLVADPATAPTIEIGYLNGKEEPEILVQDAPGVGSVFTSDKITYKIRHEWGLAVLDYRGFYWAEVS